MCTFTMVCNRMTNCSVTIGVPENTVQTQLIYHTNDCSAEMHISCTTLCACQAQPQKLEQRLVHVPDITACKSLHIRSFCSRMHTLLAPSRICRRHASQGLNKAHLHDARDADADLMTRIPLACLILTSTSLISVSTSAAMTAVRSLHHSKCKQDRTNLS